MQNDGYLLKAGHSITSVTQRYIVFLSIWPTLMQPLHGCLRGQEKNPGGNSWQTIRSLSTSSGGTWTTTFMDPTVSDSTKAGSATIQWTSGGTGGCMKPAARWPCIIGMPAG